MAAPKTSEKQRAATWMDFMKASVSANSDAQSGGNGCLSIIVFPFTSLSNF